jgi:hypothetical protein
VVGSNELLSRRTGETEQFTHEEERMFDIANNMFRGTVIGALANKYVDSYLTCTSAKEL